MSKLFINVILTNPIIFTIVSIIIIGGVSLFLALLLSKFLKKLRIKRTKEIVFREIDNPVKQPKVSPKFEINMLLVSSMAVLRKINEIGRPITKEDYRIIKLTIAETERLLEKYRM